LGAPRWGINLPSFLPDVREEGSYVSAWDVGLRGGRFLAWGWNWKTWPTCQRAFSWCGLRRGRRRTAGQLSLLDN
jgi:hypothetical protein